MANTSYHPKRPVADRLADKTDRRGPDECWLWRPGPSNRSGHGQMSVNNRMRQAHRLVFEVAYGPIPAGVVIRHTCHRPLCVNPRHLMPGSVADNNADTAKLNRALRRLADAHPDEFRQYLTEEMGGFHA